MCGSESEAGSGVVTPGMAGLDSTGPSGGAEGCLSAWGMQGRGQALVPRPCPGVPPLPPEHREGRVRPAGQVLQGSLPELVVSCTLTFFLERKTQRCPRNGPGEAKDWPRGRTECCGRAKAVPEGAWRGNRGPGDRAGSPAGCRGQVPGGFLA